LSDFTEAIFRNRLQTMDAFLEEHPRYRPVGARLTATILTTRTDYLWPVINGLADEV
jgi:hypothetical protein